MSFLLLLREVFVKLRLSSSFEQRKNYLTNYDLQSTKLNLQIKKLDVNLARQRSDFSELLLCQNYVNHLYNVTLFHDGFLKFFVSKLRVERNVRKFLKSSVSFVTKLGQTRDLGITLFSYAVMMPLITGAEELFCLFGGEWLLFGGLLALFREAMRTRGRDVTGVYREPSDTKLSNALYLILLNIRYVL